MQWPAEVLQYRIELSPFMSYNWLFQWDYLHSINGGFVSTYNWYFGPYL